MSDVDELTRELDLDAALARTYELGEGLRRRSTARKRWATGGALAAAAIAAVLVVPSLGGDDAQPGLGIAGGGATTQVAPTTTQGTGDIPAGFVLSTEGDVQLLTRQAAVPETTTSWDGSAVVGVGDAAALERGAIASAMISEDGLAATVEFDCVSAGQQLDEVRYRVEPGRVVVDASISFDPASATCLPSTPNLVIQLPLPAPVAPGTPIVAEPLHTP